MRPLRPVNPTRLGPYQLLGVLGDGGMARVYLGQSPSGRRLAIKVVRPDFARDPAFRRRFAREVAAARAVSPLFTAAVVDADTDAESPWLATTYIEGPTLDQLVADQGPLAPEAVLTLAVGLAEALASIHRTGLVHRDLKPGNVIVNDTGPHIIDFGVALLSDASYATTSLVLGTPSYMAPERLDGGEVGAPGDIFALGATLVRAATGKNLVGGGTVYEQLFQITNGRFDLSAVPRQLRPLIMHCLSHRPQDRPSAEELVTTLVGAGAQPPTPGWYTATAQPGAAEPAGPADAPVGKAGLPVRLPLGPLGALSGLASREPAPVGSPLGRSSFPSPPAGPATGSDSSLGTQQTPRLSRRRVLAFGGMAGAALAVGGVSAARSLFQRTGGGAGTHRAPGAVLWQTRTGVRPPPGPDEHGLLILLDQERIIAAGETEVRATDVRGRPLWRRTMPTDVVELRYWAGGVLAADAARLWLLDSGSGEPRLQVDLTGSEPPGSAAVQIHGVATTADLAYVNLGMATVAIDRTGGRRWRTARSAPASAGPRPPYAAPDVVDARFVAIKDPTGSGVQVSLLDAATGLSRWSVRYPVQPSPEQRKPPPPPPPGGGGSQPPPPGPDHDGPDHGEPPPDDAWQRGEGRLAAAHLALREVSDLTVLRLADGGTAWHRTSERPVASIELVGDLLLVGADRLSAYTLDTGEEVWQASLRGARIARSVRGGSVVVANDESISSFDLRGALRWQVQTPDSVRGSRADTLTVADSIAFVTYRPAGGAGDAGGMQVVAYALDDAP